MQHTKLTNGENERRRPRSLLGWGAAQEAWRMFSAFNFLRLHGGRRMPKTSSRKGCACRESNPGHKHMRRG